MASYVSKCKPQQLVRFCYPKKIIITTTTKSSFSQLSQASLRAVSAASPPLASAINISGNKNCGRSSKSSSHRPCVSSWSPTSNVTKNNSLRECYYYYYYYYSSSKFSASGLNVLESNYHQFSASSSIINSNINCAGGNNNKNNHNISFKYTMTISREANGLILSPSITRSDNCSSSSNNETSKHQNQSVDISTNKDINLSKCQQQQQQRQLCQQNHVHCSAGHQQQQTQRQKQQPCCCALASLRSPSNEASNATAPPRASNNSCSSRSASLLSVVKTNPTSTTITSNVLVAAAAATTNDQVFKRNFSTTTTTTKKSYNNNKTASSNDGGQPPENDGIPSMVNLFAQPKLQIASKQQQQQQYSDPQTVYNSRHYQAKHHFHHYQSSYSPLSMANIQKLSIEPTREHIENIRQLLGNVNAKDNNNQEIRLEKDEANGIGIVRIKSAAKNGISAKMMCDFLDVIDELYAWHEGKGVLIHGHDGFFCSGGDLVSVRELANYEDGLKMATLMQYNMGRLQALPMITMALIQGKAIGGGAEIAVAADLRAMATSSLMGYVHCRVGIMAAWGGGARLVQLVGPSRALELMSSGRLVKADEALKLGLINEIIDDTQLNNEQVIERAKKYLSEHLVGAKTSLMAIKSLVSAARTMPLEQALVVEGQLLSSTWGKPAHIEALNNNVKHRG